MSSQQLVSYIASQYKEGFSLSDIKKTLLRSGWEERSVAEAIEEALRKTQPGPPKEAPYLFGGFSPLSFQGRVIKRLIIACIAVGFFVLGVGALFL